MCKLVLAQKPQQSRSLACTLQLRTSSASAWSDSAHSYSVHATHAHNDSGSIFSAQLKQMAILGSTILSFVLCLSLHSINLQAVTAASNIDACAIMIVRLISLKSHLNMDIPKFYLNSTSEVESILMIAMHAHAARQSCKEFCACAYVHPWLI